MFIHLLEKHYVNLFLSVLSIWIFILAFSSCFFPYYVNQLGKTQHLDQTFFIFHMLHGELCKPILLFILTG